MLLSSPEVMHAFFQTVEGGKEHDIRITLPTGPFRVCEGGKEHDILITLPTGPFRLLLFSGHVEKEKSMAYFLLFLLWY